MLSDLRRKLFSFPPVQVVLFASLMYVVFQLGSRPRLILSWKIAGLYLLYGILVTIFVNLWLLKYARSLGLSNRAQLRMLGKAAKTGILPTDTAVLQAMPAYITRCRRIEERSRNGMRLMVVIIVVQLLFATLNHDTYSLLFILLFFGFLLYKMYRSSKTLAHNIPLLQAELDKKGITLSSKAETMIDQWEQGMKRRRKYAWIVITILLLVAAAIVIASSFEESRATPKMQQFTTSVDNFTILLPGKPSVGSKVIKDDSGNAMFTEREYESTVKTKHNSMMFGVIVDAWPDQQADFSSMAPSDLKSFLTGSLQEDLKASGAQKSALKEEHLFAGGKTLAEEATFTSQAAGRPYDGYFRIFSIGNTVYTILSFGASDQEFMVFANSFRFIGPSNTIMPEDPYKTINGQVTGGPDYSEAPAASDTPSNDCNGPSAASNINCASNTLQPAGQ